VDTLLGIDVGTTNIKAVLYNARGEALAEAARPTPTGHEGGRRAHHDADALWQATAAAIRRVMAQEEAHHPLGLCVASIGEAGVPLDRHNQPLYPIVAWYDERTVPQAHWWAEALGAQRIYRLTGLPLNHTYTLNKILWLKQERPEVYARLNKWLCVSDYITYRLTGEQGMGLSLASRTMALELRTRRWSVEMLETVGISSSYLPQLVAEGSPIGSVCKEAAVETGLPQGTPVYVGGHDHVCGALAVGAFEPGVVLDSTGTTEAELTTIERVEGPLQRTERAFCLGCHVAAERYYAIGGILGAGSMLEWMADLLWPQEGLERREEAIAALTQAAAASQPGANGLYLLPHMAGAGSPDRAPTARGVFCGLGLEHTRADLARAAIEGLAIELRVLLSALEQFTGQSIERIICVGGGTRNALWNEIKAQVLGRPLHIPKHTEGVTLGAAILAGLGAGVYAHEQDAMAKVRAQLGRIEPTREGADRYQRIYQRIEELRPLCTTLGRKSGKVRAQTTQAMEKDDPSQELSPTP
jgi:xylulokinase